MYKSVTYKSVKTSEALIIFPLRKETNSESKNLKCRNMWYNKVIHILWFYEQGGSPYLKYKKSKLKK